MRIINMPHSLHQNAEYQAVRRFIKKHKKDPDLAGRRIHFVSIVYDPSQAKWRITAEVSTDPDGLKLPELIGQFEFLI